MRREIERSIANYPTLYRAKTYAQSRLIVLEHYFLTNGNGAYVTKSGGLSCGYLKPAVLTDDYFSKTLWDIKTENAATLQAEFTAELPLAYNYVTANNYVIIECDEETALRYQKKYGPKERYNNFVMAAQCHYYDCDYLIAGDPYPLCQYAIMCRVLDGKITLNKVWMKAGKELAEEVIKYYTDENQYKRHSYYKCPERWDAYVTEQLTILKRFVCLK